MKEVWQKLDNNALWTGQELSRRLNAMAGRPASKGHSETAPSVAFERMARLLCKLGELEKALGVDPMYEEREDGTSKYLPDSQGASLQAEINETLAHYPFYRALFGGSMGAISTQQENLETASVRLICDVYAFGALDRVRVCFCGEWFMAHKGDRKTCSSRCAANLNNTPESRTYHRDEAKKQHEKSRSTKIESAKRILEQPLRKGHNWKQQVTSKDPTLTVNFLTRAVARGDLIPPC
jgi:hypothetical protein